jgi:hypothetical protein
MGFFEVSGGLPSLITILWLSSHKIPGPAANGIFYSLSPANWRLWRPQIKNPYMLRMRGSYEVSGGFETILF